MRKSPFRQNHRVQDTFEPQVPRADTAVASAKDVPTTTLRRGHADFVTRDLHNSGRNAGNIMTEYEKNFSEMGMKINMVEIAKPVGFSLEIPPELSKDREIYSRAESREI